MRQSQSETKSIQIMQTKMGNWLWGKQETLELEKTMIPSGYLGIKNRGSNEYTYSG